MAFINERISDADCTNYQLAEIDKRYSVGGNNSRIWTIDKGRKIYLRLVQSGREDDCHLSTWSFYWKGHLIEVRLEYISSTNGHSGHVSSHMRLIGMTLPLSLTLSKSKVLTDLKDALVAYRDGGVYATASSYDLELDIAAGV